MAGGGGGLRLGLEVDVRLPAGPLHLRARFALDAERGALWGPSAAGKSTLLRVLAGLTKPAAGYVRLGGSALVDVDAGAWVPPGQRRIGFLTQGSALFPHLSTEENVRFGLRGLPGAEGDRRVEEVCGLLGLAGLRARRPQSLSGGERQRVALARTLARRPRLLLLDEPFSAVDGERKQELWALLDGYLQAHGMACLLVSHDPAEVWSWAEWVVRLEAGEVIAVGTPREMLTEERKRVLAQLVEEN